MDVADVVDENGVIRLRAHHALGVGRHEPIPDQALAIVSGGRVVATIKSEDGAVELTPPPRSDAFGIYRVSERESGDPLTSVEQDVAVVRPASRPLVLFDSRRPRPSSASCRASTGSTCWPSGCARRRTPARFAPACGRWDSLPA